MTWDAGSIQRSRVLGNDLGSRAIDLGTFVEKLGTWQKPFVKKLEGTWESSPRTWDRSSRNLGSFAEKSGIDRREVRSREIDVRAGHLFQIQVATRNWRVYSVNARVLLPSRNWEVADSARKKLAKTKSQPGIGAFAR